MIFCGRYLLSLLLALTLIQASTLLWWRDWVCDQWLRPAVVALLERQLQAEVHLDRLRLSWNDLQLRGLAIEKTRRYRFQLPAAQIRFRLGELWHRQLATVQLRQPRLELLAIPPRDGDAPTVFPPHPPLEIADLRINDGELLAPVNGRRQRLQQLQLRLAGIRQSRFEVRGRLGAGAGLPFALTGSGSWSASPQLTLSHIDWNEVALLETPLQIQLDPAGASLSGRVGLPQLDRTELERWCDALNLTPNLPEQLDFRIDGPQISFRLEPSDLELRLQFPSAELIRQGRRVSLETVQLTLRKPHDDWEISGRFTLEQTLRNDFRASYNGDRGLQGSFSAGIGRLAAVVERYLPDSPVSLAGAGNLTGEFSSRAGSSRWQLLFTGKPLAGTDSANSIDCSRVALQLIGESHNEQLSGTLQLLLSGRELVRLSGTTGEATLQLGPVSRQELQALLGPALLPTALATMDGLRASGALAQTDNGDWQGDFRLALDQLQTGAASLSDLALGGRFRLREENIELTDLHLAGAGALAEGRFRFAGSGSATLTPTHYRLLLPDLTVSDGEYFSSDGMNGLTGGMLRADLALTGNRTEPVVEIDLKTAFGAAELLAGPYYANLSGTEGRLALNGRVDYRQRRLQADRISLDLPELLSVQGQGEVGTDHLFLQASLRSGELGAAFRRYGKSPLENAASRFADLRVSGYLNAELELQKDPAVLGARILLQPQQLGLKLDAWKLDLEGLSGALPLCYLRGERPAPPSPRRGELRFNRVEIGPARLTQAPLRLLSSENRLQIAAFPPWELAGGQVRISDLSTDLKADQMQVSTRIRVAAVDLATLTRELGGLPMSGELSADLGTIHYAAGDLNTEGQAEIDAFGGNLVISNIELHDLASAYRTLHGDVDFTGIDLYQLTRTLEFGEINGIVDGHVHKLRLFGGTPSQFDAELATRLRGRRDISVKALNNLSILSQGGISAALSRGIYQFIDYYRYQKIGLHCILNNDLFQLRGTARPDADGYLVYGGLLPPKIDIIAPGRDVSFKEMLKRLSRLDRTGR